MVKRSYITEKELFRALSHPVRRDIIKQLQYRPSSVSNLARTHSVSLPAISQHLQVLEKAGLVRSYRWGKSRVYNLQRQNLLRFYKLVKDLVKQPKPPRFAKPRL